MLRYVDLVQNPRRFLALTGYTVGEFRALLSFLSFDFTPMSQCIPLRAKPVNIDCIAPNTNSPLPTMEDKLLFILNDLKTHPLQETHAQLFGMQQSQASQWMHLLLPLGKQSLADCGALPARTMADVNLDEEDIGLYLHDGTERAINRPQDPEKQKLY